MGYKLLKWHIFQSPLHPAYVLRCGVVSADYGSCHMGTHTQMMPLVVFVDIPTTPEEKEPTIPSPPTTSLDLKQSQGSAAFQPKKYEMKAYILDVDQYWHSTVMREELSQGFVWDISVGRSAV